MYLSNLYKYLVVTSGAMVMTMSAFAEENLSSYNDINNDVFTPKYIKLIESHSTLDLKLSKGHTLTLPQYRKVEKCYPFSASINDRLNLKTNFRTHSLKNKLAELHEIKGLSEKLHIDSLDIKYLDFYREIANWLGTRYRMGSMSQNAVDCSGFTKIIYNTVFNKNIPRTSRDMSNSLTETLSVNELLPGDLVFFATRGKKHINHVGMYIGEGNFVHASINGVKVSSLTEGYYRKTWRKAGRID